MGMAQPVRIWSERAKAMKILAITAGAFGGLLVLLLAALAFISTPLDGEPYAYLDIRDKSIRFDNTIPYDRAKYDPRKPVIAIHPIPQAGVLGRDIADGYPVKDGIDVSLPIRFQSPAELAFDASLASSLESLGTAHIDALIEETPFGPLPKIATDGRRPSEAYARPFDPVRSKGGQPMARVAILIKGLGMSQLETQEAIEKLPSPVSLAFGPYGSHLQDWAVKARRRGHELLLEVPLEPYDYPDNDPGPHTLRTSLPTQENINRLKWLLARFTGYIGVTNIMGAKFVGSKEDLQPIWRELTDRGLVYFDSSRNAGSPNDRLASELGLVYGTAEVMIDASNSEDDIDAALTKLETMAKQRGLAIGVGSALPITIDRIKKWSQELAKKGIVLIPLSAALKARRQA